MLRPLEVFLSEFLIFWTEMESPGEGRPGFSDAAGTQESPAQGLVSSGPKRPASEAAARRVNGLVPLVHTLQSLRLHVQNVPGR